MNTNDPIHIEADEIELWELLLHLIKYKLHLILFAVLGTLTAFGMYLWQNASPTQNLINPINNIVTTSTMILEYNNILEIGLPSHQYFPDFDFKGEEIKLAENYFEINGFSGKQLLDQIIIKSCQFCRALNYPIEKGGFSARAESKSSSSGGDYIAVQLGGLVIELLGEKSKKTLKNLFVFFEHRATASMIKAIEQRILDLKVLIDAKQKKEDQLLVQLEKQKNLTIKLIVTDELKRIFQERLKSEVKILTYEAKITLLNSGSTSFFTTTTTTTKTEHGSLLIYLTLGLLIGGVLGIFSIFFKINLLKAKQSESYSNTRQNFFSALKYWKF
jgi:hypothetical protein